LAAAAETPPVVEDHALPAAEAEAAAAIAIDAAAEVPGTADAVAAAAGETSPPASASEPLGPPLQPVMEDASDPRPPARSGFQQNDPLAAVAALSYEEKIALFT
jgi:hypothetical protein